MKFFIRFRERLVERAMMRAPDFIIGGRENPYLLRWFVIPRNPLCNIYVLLKNSIQPVRNMV